MNDVMTDRPAPFIIGSWRRQPEHGITHRRVPAPYGKDVVMASFYSSDH